MGGISDVTRSRIGRRRPYLLATAIPFGLIFFFLLGPMKTSGITGGLIRLIIIIILSYSLYITINSANSLLNIDNMFVNPNLASVRTNYLLNLLLCVSIGLLILYIFNGIFN